MEKEQNLKKMYNRENQQNWKADRPLERLIKKNHMPNKKGMLKRQYFE